ncbi:lipopolysaccharide biosynthesis protein [Edaphocola aurantiacus]|jgi:O-antigen/teichoic acid export membrane protein|uniref:lipopolysaccharide biosynthesis protein n=1 Tax=Edaphocola aurantiacus TaxID=2601682 RepID=UPI001C939734|nr:lipopolysaccharide biosynthesis protein [Edaphocola aurantiacus]
MSINKELVSGVFWSFLQQFSSQIINFIVSIILARLLLPDDFGQIALFGVVMALGGVLINGGLTTSLIRTKNITEEDLSTVFFFNMAMSVLIYLIIVLVAPLIATFYKIPALTAIIRVYSITLIIGAFGAVQHTIFSKELKFKLELGLQLPASIISAATGIVLAYQGFGVWALVWMNILQSSVFSILLWITSPWRPKFIFNKEKFKYHFNFGYKLSLSSLLDTLFNNIYTIFIGKLYSPTQLGYYNRADSMKQLPVSNISQVLNKVTLPLFAKIQDDSDALRALYKKIMTSVLFVLAPILAYLVVEAEAIFTLLFTHKWDNAVPYFQILCIAGLLYPIHAYNLNILYVRGRSDLFLKLEVIKKILIVIILVVSSFFGIYGLLWGQVVFSFIALFINSYYSGKFIDYGFSKQIRDLLPACLLSFVVGIIVFGADKFFLFKFTDLMRIVLAGICYFSLYFVIAMIFKFSEISFLKQLIKRK